MKKSLLSLFMILSLMLFLSSCWEDKDDSDTWSDVNIETWTDIDKENDDNMWEDDIMDDNMDEKNENDIDESSNESIWEEESMSWEEMGIISWDNMIDEELSSIQNDEDSIVKEFYMESYSQMIDGKPAPRFSLSTIEVNKWDNVRFIIKTTSWKHNFNLDEFDINVDTPLDEEVVVEFVADKAWSFEYYCSMPWHRANGHWGTLIVNDVE